MRSHYQIKDFFKNLPFYSSEIKNFFKKRKILQMLDFYPNYQSFLKKKKKI